VIDGNCCSLVSIVEARCRPLLTQRVMAIGFMCVPPMNRGWSLGAGFCPERRPPCRFFFWQQSRTGTEAGVRGNPRSAGCFSRELHAGPEISLGGIPWRLFQG
jgi:hypothetical protein